MSTKKGGFSLALIMAIIVAIGELHTTSFADTCGMLAGRWLAGVPVRQA